MAENRSFSLPLEVIGGEGREEGDGGIADSIYPSSAARDLVRNGLL